jgi:hypothetical protein
MNEPQECATTDCEAEAVTAIMTSTPKNKSGLVTTIYQFEEDAPKRAVRYCGPCAVRLAASLTALTDGDIKVAVIAEVIPR